MKTRIRLALLALLVVLHEAAAQSTAFTYQGVLSANGMPINGPAEVQFTLWDTESGGTMPIASNTPPVVSLTATNGQFTALLDFGAMLFDGSDRWLQINLRTTLGPFIALTPRQKIMPTPYAIRAANFAGTIASNQLAGIYANALTFNNAGNNFVGSFVGDGSTLTNVNAATVGGLSASNIWRTDGNSGTAAGTHFLGTTDNQPLELKVNGMRALRVEFAGDSAFDPDSLADGAPNIIGGAPVNFVAPGIVGATIAGGGATNYFGSSSTNRVSAIFGTIGGGRDNSVAADHSVIAGGYANRIEAVAYDSVIGGGVNNVIMSNAFPGATIAGGSGNTIQTNASGGVIGGGSANSIGANTLYATVPGGSFNSASGSYSFAAGLQAKANHNGTFVWADSTGIDFPSTAANEFLVRATRGFGVNMNNPGAVMHVVGDSVTDQMILQLEGSHPQGAWLNLVSTGSGGRQWNIISTAASNGEGPGKLLFRSIQGVVMTLSTNGNVGIGTVNPTNRLHVAGGVSATAFVSTSDQNAKKDFSPVSPRDVLAKVAALPISTWNFKELHDGRHMGPTAQDFYSAFGLGSSDTTITTVDPDGVALAAIQGLNELMNEKNARIAALEKSMAELKELVAKLAEKH